MADELEMVKVEECIAAVCDDIREMLLRKNRKYGNSALAPKRIFSRASPQEQIFIRIDDKLSRIANLPVVEVTADQEDGEKTIDDLMGYLVLLNVQARLSAERDLEVDTVDAGDDGTPVEFEEESEEDEAWERLADDVVTLRTALVAEDFEVALSNLPRIQAPLGIELLGTIQQNIRAQRRELESARTAILQTSGDGRGAVLALREIYDECSRRLPSHQYEIQHRDALGDAILRGIWNLARRGLNGDPLFIQRAAMEVALQCFPAGNLSVATGEALDAIGKTFGMTREARNQVPMEVDDTFRIRIGNEVRGCLASLQPIDVEARLKVALALSDRLQANARAAQQELQSIKDSRRYLSQRFDETVATLERQKAECKEQQARIATLESAVVDLEQKHNAAMQAVIVAEQMKYRALENTLDETARARDAERSRADDATKELSRVNRTFDESVARMNERVEALNGRCERADAMKHKLRNEIGDVDEALIAIGIDYTFATPNGGKRLAAYIRGLRERVTGETKLRLEQTGEMLSTFAKDAKTLQESLTEQAIKQFHILMRHQDRYLKAWCIATKVDDPRKVAMEVRHDDRTGAFTVKFVRNAEVA